MQPFLLTLKILFRNIITLLYTFIPHSLFLSPLTFLCAFIALLKVFFSTVIYISTHNKCVLH